MGATPWTQGAYNKPELERQSAFLGRNMPRGEHCGHPARYRGTKFRPFWAGVFVMDPKADPVGTSGSP